MTLISSESRSPQLTHLLYLGGNRTKTPGPGAQSALRALARSGMKIGRIGSISLTTISLFHFFLFVALCSCFFFLFFRGCDSHPYWQHTKKGRSPRSSFVSNKKRGWWGFDELDEKNYERIEFYFSLFFVVGVRVCKRLLCVCFG